MMNTLRRGDEQVRVEPRHMDLLVYLARRAGDVVSADEILEHVWPGVVVGDHSVYQGIARLRKALGDGSQRPRYIETVAKRGYRLLGEVVRPETTAGRSGREGPLSAGAMEEGTDRGSPGTSQSAANSAAGRWWGLALLLLSLALAAGFAWFTAESGSGRRIYRTVAVLPFGNLGQDAENAFFAEELSEELIDALGHLEHLRVIGRTSSFSAGLREKGTTEIGRVLGAEALVEGRVRRSADRLRVFVQVIDGETGYQVWSETYQRRLADVFEIREEIARDVAEALRGKIDRFELSRLAKAAPASIEAYDYYLLGQYYRGTRSVSGLRRALAMYGEAKRVDPNYAPAYLGIGTSNLLLSYYGDLTLSRAVALARPVLERALRLDPTDEETPGAIGLGHYLMGEYRLAEQHLDQAVAMNPNYAEGWMWCGLAVEKQGRLREALENYRKAVSLEPLMVPVLVNHANALNRLGMRDQASDRLERLTESIRDAPELYRALASLARDRGDLAQAYHWSKTALDLAAGEASSAAGMALTLAISGQSSPALEWADRALEGGFPGQGASEMLELVYLHSGEAERLDELAKERRTLFVKEDVPEIDWRRMSARSGMAKVMLGDYRQAIEALEDALEGESYAIVSTDFDLLYCTSLAFAYGREGDRDHAEKWTVRCRAAWGDAADQGWNSHWMGYARARLAILQNDFDGVVQQLERIVANGFRGFGLIANDPLFQSIEPRHRIRKLLASLEDSATEDRKHRP